MKRPTLFYFYVKNRPKTPSNTPSLNQENISEHGHLIDTQNLIQQNLKKISLLNFEFQHLSFKNNEIIKPERF